VTELLHNASNPITASIQRAELAGRAAVCKVISGTRASVHPDWHAAPDPPAWNWWQREDRLLAHGLPPAWGPAGLRLPRLLQREVWANGDIALWLEAMDGRHGPSLTLADHLDLCRRLGRAQGVAVPSAAWHSRGFLRDHCGSKHVDPAWLRSDAAWAEPLVRDGWPPGLRAGLERLHARREVLFAAAEAAPRGFCHLDLWAYNAFAVDGGFVLLDGGCAGDGALGEDVCNLVAEAGLDGLVAADQVPALGEACFAAYVDGLRAVGWDGDAAAVRRGFCASAVKFHWLGPLHLERAVTGVHHRYGGARDASPAGQYRRRGATLAWLVGLADAV
jgi:hypothetical protein